LHQKKIFERKRKKQQERVKNKRRQFCTDEVRTEN